MSKIRASLKKLIGRVDKVKIVRELLMVALIPYGAFLYKFISEVQALSKLEDINRLMQTQPAFFMAVDITICGFSFCGNFHS